MSYCEQCKYNYDDIEAHHLTFHAPVTMGVPTNKPQIVQHPQLGPLVCVQVQDMHQSVADYLVEKTAQRVVQLLTDLSEGKIHGANRETRRKLRTVPKT